MDNQYKIHVALPRRPAIRSAIENAIQAASDLGLGDYDLTDEISKADVVVTDNETLDNEIGRVPSSVRLLQLTGCGSGAPNVTDENLIVANASTLLAVNPADWAIDQWREIARRYPRHQSGRTIVAGIVGFGTLGIELASRLNEQGAKIWVNDIRTPRQMSFQNVGASRSSLDMVLSRSDVVFVSVHHGPTSDPLLSHRELSLLSVGATIINLSGEQVVDQDAIDELNEQQERQIDYRRMPSDLRRSSASRRPQTTSAWILNNLGHFALGHQPRSIVEQVTHPSAGDPAFWASRMAPKQTPG